MGHAAVCEMLLERGSDPRLPDASGLSPAGAARASGHPDLAGRLQSVEVQAVRARGEGPRSFARPTLRGLPLPSSGVQGTAGGGRLEGKDDDGEAEGATAVSTGSYVLTGEPSVTEAEPPTLKADGAPAASAAPAPMPRIMSLSFGAHDPPSRESAARVGGSVPPAGAAAPADQVPAGAPPGGVDLHLSRLCNGSYAEQPWTSPDLSTDPEVAAARATRATAAGAAIATGAVGVKCGPCGCTIVVAARTPCNIIACVKCSRRIARQQVGCPCGKTH